MFSFGEQKTCLSPQAVNLSFAGCKYKKSCPRNREQLLIYLENKSYPFLKKSSTISGDMIVSTNI